MRKLLFLLIVAAGARQGAAQSTNEYDAELAQGAVSVKSSFTAIGEWRGVFQTRPGLEVPFNFEIRDSRDGAPELFFLNAGESFDGGRVTRRGDSLFIAINQFDNELALGISGDSLSGVLRRQDGTGQALALRATKDGSRRFDPRGIAPAKNISGTYAVSFLLANGQEEKSVGLFKQKGAKLEATFLHITGDSRYLEGVVEGDSFRLSSFIGSGPTYYRGRIGVDGTISGEIAGVRGNRLFRAVPDGHAALPDAYTLTALKPGYSTLDFSFPDADGHPISLRDDRFRNKVVVVTIGGTWCPNCIDETAFLSPWYRANRDRGIEVVSIQYERQTDTEFVHKVLGRMRERYAIDYMQVIGGLADKKAVASSLPALNGFLAFPTTIFVDRQGKVAKIHTGFNGPATGRYYQEFVKEFNDEVDLLLR